MRKALSIVLVFAIAVVCAPITALAVEKNARGSAAQPEKTGNIAGKITDIKPGQDLTVQVRNAQGQLVSNPITPGPTGEFTFSGLTPGTYTVQVVQGTQVLPITVTVAAGQTATVTLSAAALTTALAAGAAGGILGMSTTLAVTTLTIAGVTIGTIVAVQANQEPASASR